LATIYSIEPKQIEDSETIVLEPEGIEVGAREAWDAIGRSDDWEDVCAALDDLGLGQDFESFISHWDRPTTQRINAVMGEAIRSAALEIKRFELFGPYLVALKRQLIEAVERKEFEGQKALLVELANLIQRKLEAGGPAFFREPDSGFALGFAIGQAQLLLQSSSTSVDAWKPAREFSAMVKREIEKSVSRERGRQRHKWPDGLRAWLRQKVQVEHMKADGSLKTSARQIALKVRAEAMEYRREAYGESWTNEQAAFEWLQKMVSKVSRE